MVRFSIYCCSRCGFRRKLFYEVYVHILDLQPSIFSSSRSKTLPRLAKLEPKHISKNATYISSPGPGTVVRGTTQRGVGRPPSGLNDTQEQPIVSISIPCSFSCPGGSHFRLLRLERKLEVVNLKGN